MSREILIRMQSVKKEYREAGKTRPVLCNAQLEVRRGEVIALLGRSGSGKSTLLNLLAGIDQLDAGEIHIAGERVDVLDEPRRTLFRRRHIGFIYQFFNLIPTLKVAENVVLPLELNGHPAPANHARVDDLLREMGLADRRDDFPDQLSGGEQQRVAIARALAHDPPLVLADEPTGNLDAETGQQILNLLTDIIRNQPRTLVIVTHSLQVAKRADRVLTLHNGALEAAAPDLAW